MAGYGAVMSRCNVSGDAGGACTATPLVSEWSASEYAIRTQAWEADCATWASARYTPRESVRAPHGVGGRRMSDPPQLSLYAGSNTGTLANGFALARTGQ